MQVYTNQPGNSAEAMRTIVSTVGDKYLKTALDPEFLGFQRNDRQYIGFVSSYLSQYLASDPKMTIVPNATNSNEVVVSKLNAVLMKLTSVRAFINENLDVIEEVDNLEGRNLVEIKGLDLSIVNDKSRVDDLHTYKNILANFYPFISQNKEEIHLSSLDISNIVNIIGYIGDIEIFFGDDSDLYNKMENVYRIILNDGINMKKGYINVSINGSPVIKNEPVEEDEAESNEENQVTDEFEQDVIIQGLE